MSHSVISQFCDSNMICLLYVDIQVARTKVYASDNWRAQTWHIWKHCNGL